MSEQRMEDVGDVKQEVQPEHSSGVRYTETLADAKAKIEAEKVKETAESLGVDQASYDKYYKNGDFDWASYGKEQAFKAKQAAKKEDKPAENKPATAAENAENKAAEPATEADTDAARTAVADAGLDWDALGQEILDTGDISKEAREALHARNIPDALIDRHIELLQKDVDAVINKAVDGFGGDEMFTQVFDGLQKNATVEQRESIDALLLDPKTFDEGIALGFKLSGVTPPSKEATPSPKPQTVNTPNASTGGTAVTGFANFEEQVAAMRDPRYKTDAAYRAEVMEKVRAGSYDVNPRAHTSGL